MGAYPVLATVVDRAQVKDLLHVAAADLGAWLCFEDESGQGLRPPKGRTWGRRGRTPVVRVTAQGSKRVSVAALIAARPGAAGRARLIYRTHLDRGSVRHRRKGFTETDYARLLDAAHQQPPRAPGRLPARVGNSSGLPRQRLLLARGPARPGRAHLQAFCVVTAETVTGACSGVSPTDDDDGGATDLSDWLSALDHARYVPKSWFRLAFSQVKAFEGMGL